MTVVIEEIIKDLDLAREILSTTDYYIVVISNEKIWNQKKGEGIRPVLETIREMGEDIYDSIIGVRTLGKASALLSRYAKAKGVYSPQGTKTGIALLIMGGVPCQVDELIPFIKDRDGSGLSHFEKMLKDVISPEEAYKILKEEVIGDQHGL
ncbi:MAG: DUF1893 domain-containing protein [Thermoplasmatales archaeon]|nr:DUF1893 domain-containing protein [Thermoplasmatales archaeon]